MNVVSWYNFLGRIIRFIENWKGGIDRKVNEIAWGVLTESNRQFDEKSENDKHQILKLAMQVLIDESFGRNVIDISYKEDIEQIHKLAYGIINKGIDEGLFPDNKREIEIKPEGNLINQRQLFENVELLYNHPEVFDMEVDRFLAFVVQLKNFVVQLKNMEEQQEQLISAKTITYYKREMDRELIVHIGGWKKGIEKIAIAILFFLEKKNFGFDEQQIQRDANWLLRKGIRKRLPKNGQLWPSQIYRREKNLFTDRVFIW